MENDGVDTESSTENFNNDDLFEERRRRCRSNSLTDSEKSEPFVVNDESAADAGEISNCTPIISRQASSSSDGNVWSRFLMRYKVELCVFFAVFFSVLTTFLQASGMIKPKLQLRRQAPSQRYFSPSSPVHDLYHGNSASVHDLLLHGEFVMVMYYAPWSIRCTEARIHFDRLARSFDDSVQFFAVNCWDPGGKCRILYKMYTYPVFILYSTTSFRGIYYNGVVSADYMYRFLKNVLNPFVRLDDASDVDRFLLASDVSTVLAYFDFSQTLRASGFDTYHWTTMKALEQDPFRDQIRFALVTDSRLARYYNLTKNGIFRFYNWSSSFDNYFDYATEERLKSDSLVKWMFDLTTDKIKWFYNSDYSKSVSLQDLLANASLVLFTPRQPLYESSRDFLSLSTVAMKYFDCDDSPFVDRTVSVMRRCYGEAYRSNERWKEACGEGRRLSTSDCCRKVVVARTYATHRNICDVCLPPPSYEMSPVVTTTTLYNGNPASFVSSSAEVVVERVCSKFTPQAKTMDSFASSIITTSRSCDELSQYLRINKLVEYCCESQQSSKRSSNTDTLSVSSLIMYEGQNVDDRLAYCNKHPNRTAYCNTFAFIDRTLSTECKKLRLMKTLNYADFLPPSFKDDDVSFVDAQVERDLRGLSCRTNKTLKFVAIDSNHYRHFAENLGLSVKNNSDSNNFSTVIIFDKQQESLYEYPSSLKLSTNGLSYFITNYTNSRLRRFLKSDSTSAHAESNRNKQHQSWTNCDNRMYRICIDKITSANFNEKILQRKRDVVLLYTTTWCGMCHQTYHVYQSLAYYFRFISSDLLTFAMIDADKNDLPWQYTVDAYPTILYFPARNFNETVAFPRRLPLTLPNLISFVLANCAWRIRLDVAFSACSKRCLMVNTRLISDQLKRYQRSLSRLKFVAQDKAYLWEWVDDDPDFGPLIPSYLTGIWKDIAETEVKVRTLRLLLRFLWASDRSLTELNTSSRIPFSLDDLLSFVQNYSLISR